MSFSYKQFLSFPDKMSCGLSRKRHRVFSTESPLTMASSAPSTKQQRLSRSSNVLPKTPTSTTPRYTLPLSPLGAHVRSPNTPHIYLSPVKTASVPEEQKENLYSSISSSAVKSHRSSSTKMTFRGKSYFAYE